MSIVLFDLDDTLLEGDSERLWCQFLAEKGLVDKPFINCLDQFFEAYAEGNLDFVAYEKFVLQTLTENKLDYLITLRKQYLEKIRPFLRPFMLKRIIRHKSQGHTLILITAANSFLARPIAKVLNIHHVICTEIETINHVPTGNLIGSPAFNVGKVEKLDVWLTEHQQTLAQSWAYSDSHNDFPILNKVTYPVAVKPDAQLFSQALELGWEIIP
jgi:HAD superfamily hydrolase (TIGR01490 family)